MSFDFSELVPQDSYDLSSDFSNYIGNGYTDYGDGIMTDSEGNYYLNGDQVWSPYDNSTGSDSNWLNNILKYGLGATTGQPTGNETFDNSTNLLKSLLGWGLDLGNAAENNQTRNINQDALKAATALAQDTNEQNFWQQGFQNYANSTDKMVGLTDSMLKTDLARKYFTDTDAKTEWMYNKMFENGNAPSSILGGLNAMKSATTDLFGNLAQAKTDYSGYRDDYSNLRNLINLPAVNYGNAKNPFMNYRVPSQQQLTSGGLNTMLNI